MTAPATYYPSPLIVAKNMAALRARQAAIAQCGRQIAVTTDDGEIAFWREVMDHLEKHEL